MDLALCKFFWGQNYTHLTLTFHAEPPAFEVLPSLKRLKQRVIAAGRGQYDAVFMSGRYSFALIWFMFVLSLFYICVSSHPFSLRIRVFKQMGVSI